MAAKLFKTLRDGDLDGLTDLIQNKGANVNEADKKGYTPLIECASVGFAEGIAPLLSAGANIESKEKITGRTALIVATIEGQAEVVEALLANPNISKAINLTDDEGMTALHWALKLEQQELVGALLGHEGVRVDIIAKDGYSPLMYACGTRNEDIVKILLSRPGVKNSLNAKDKSGNTPLHIAALVGHAGIVSALLSFPPTSKPDPLNSNLETPLHLAAADNNYEVVRLLIANKADVQAKTKDGLTPYQVSDSDSESAKEIAKITGETPNIVREADVVKKEVAAATSTKESVKNEPVARKRTRTPTSTASQPRGRQDRTETRSPLLARVFLVIVLGSSLAYLVSMFW